MRHRVVIERRSATQDAAGEPTVAWTTVVDRRASMRRSPGTEVFSSEQRLGRVPTEFRLRYAAGILPQMRLRLTSETPEKLYNVLSAIDPDGRRSELIVTALELVEGQA